jgi:hypothetical protein
VVEKTVDGKESLKITVKALHSRGRLKPRLQKRRLHNLTGYIGSAGGHPVPPVRLVLLTGQTDL